VPFVSVDAEAKAATLFTFTCATYNLVRLRSLLAEPSLA
jgi:hypothetical protein